MSREILSLRGYREDEQNDNPSLIEAKEDLSGDVFDIVNLSNLDNCEYVEIFNSLNETVIGQNDAKKQIADIISYSIHRIRNNRGPLGILFFHGPTGVGKTETARGLSRFLFGSDNGFIKIDMAEFGESHSKNRFIGSPAGYIGYDDEPVFSPKTFYNSYDIAKETNNLNPIISSLGPINIILFDEVEKAHPSVLQSLLGIMDEGKLSLSNTKKGTLNFGNSIIIFTSNVGQKEISESIGKKSIGFVSDTEESSNIDKNDIFNKSLKSVFSPEFLGRIPDENFIEYKSLNTSELKQIIDINIDEFKSTVNLYFENYPNIDIKLDDSVYEYILSNYYNKNKGARDLVRGYYDFVEKKINLLMSSSYMSKYENNTGLINTFLFVESGDLKIKINYDSKYSEFEEILNKNNPNLNDSDDVIIKIEGNGIINLEGFINSSNSINNLTIFTRRGVLFIINSESVNNFNSGVLDMFGTYDRVSLSSPNLSKLGIKVHHIIKLIDIYIDAHFGGIDEIKLHILVSIYSEIDGKKMADETIDMKGLSYEIMTIIDKRLLDYGLN